jgi:heme/copper-type cytochrome/quinol oxidase subunit 4
MGIERIQRSATRVMSLAMTAIGVALVVQAVSNGGSVLRIVLGVLFVAAGVGRLYILHLRTRADGDGRG